MRMGGLGRMLDATISTISTISTIWHKKTACKQAVSLYGGGKQLAHYQPISLSSSNVRSTGTVSEWVRSALMAGSINWLRRAEVL